MRMDGGFDPRLASISKITEGGGGAESRLSADYRPGLNLNLDQPRAYFRLQLETVILLLLNTDRSSLKAAVTLCRCSPPDQHPPWSTC